MGRFPGKSRIEEFKVSHLTINHFLQQFPKTIDL